MRKGNEMKEEVIKVGCNTIIVKKEKILLGKRKNCYKSGTWGLPGGHLELGEDLIDGAKRELWEEVGIKDPKLEFLSVVEGDKDEAHYIQVNFLLKDFKGEPVLTEEDKCEEWGFFSMEELPKNIFPPHKKVLEAYKKGKHYFF